MKGKGEGNDSKYVLPEKIDGVVGKVRLRGESIVTLNGSFDLLHVGHLTIIEEAKGQGDRLIVALNTDRSIRAYKGDRRPIVPLARRLRMVAALSQVDFVTHFDEEDPRELLARIRPDVHVNGSEYGADCIEADTVKKGGGRVHIVSLVPGLSTSALIKRIQSLHS
ncbi:MAG: adenylyltransferase/cytidyltransferase family protein [Simkaniaceae bacterium]|nr:adenylyltransferase/cytidyltransferase family protein [Simkaniaceae bacterium]